MRHDTIDTLFANFLRVTWLALTGRLLVLVAAAVPARLDPLEALRQEYSFGQLPGSNLRTPGLPLASKDARPSENFRV